MELQKLLRNNIRNLKAYSSARSEFEGNASVFLDANENPFNSPYNRYPDPLQRELKELIAKQKGVQVNQIFTGNGSDEAIDLLIRAFCEPRTDNIVSITPSYGMYEVAANTNDVEFRTVPLTADYQLDPGAILANVNAYTKLIYICSPNNPTGNCFDEQAIKQLIQNFKGIVVVDEAYIDFAPERSLVKYLADFDNLVILQTLSKAWGLAGIRLGMAFAGSEIISVLNKIKYPYNVNVLTQQKAIDFLSNPAAKENWVTEILQQRSFLLTELRQLTCVKKVYPTEANFVLIKVDDANKIYNYLVSEGIIVRNRTHVFLCEGGLRITVGSAAENSRLINALASISF
jgi:histidinol-phosphate aminotransferase